MPKNSFSRPHQTARGHGKKSKPKDNPEIRHSHAEEKEINLNENYEVEHAQQAGAIKVHKDPGGKSASVEPVKGKSKVENGKLVYIDKEKSKE